MMKSLEQQQDNGRGENGRSRTDGRSASLTDQSRTEGRSASLTSSQQRAESSDSGALTLCDGVNDQLSEKSILGSPSAFSVYSPISGRRRLQRGEEVEEDDKDSIDGLKSSTTKTMSKRMNSSKTLHILKELVDTERTTVYNLRLLTEDLKSVLDNVKETVPGCRTMIQFINALQPVLEYHRRLLIDLDNRIDQWDDNREIGLGEIFLCLVHNTIPHYRQLIAMLPISMAALDQLYRLRPEFQSAILDLEQRPRIYLPIDWLMIKATTRMSDWQETLARLVTALLEEGGQLSECRVALDKVAQLNQSTEGTRSMAFNFVQLMEISRDLCGISDLVNPSRRFIREGQLQRWSRRGLVSRLFILFSDTLIYANRSSTIVGLQGFTVHGQMPLRSLMFEDGDAFDVVGIGMPSFTIHDGKQSMVLVANNESDKDKWLRDLEGAIRLAKETRSALLPTLPKIEMTVDENAEENGTEGAIVRSKLGTFAHQETVIIGQTGRTLSSLTDRLSRRSTSFTHVCWHRGVSIGQGDFQSSIDLSGPLMRKLRNSTGWQKLWVVLSNGSLFFYKMDSDDPPLATLPLLDYRISLPELTDEIVMERVFKLHYKLHNYFFRADSSYAFARWIECIQKATGRPSPAGVLAAFAAWC